MFTRERAGSARRREGFALPLAVLTLALVSAAMVAAYAATRGEIIENNAMRAQDRAYHLAEAGMQEFLLRRGEGGFCSSCTFDPTTVDSEWTRVGLEGGYADVVAMRVRRARSNSQPALFFLRSTGVDTIARLGGAGGPAYATRTVGQYASFGTASLKPLAAWTSLNGITNTTNGASYRIDGSDQCGSNPTVGGAAVPGGGQYTGSGGLPAGSPRVDSATTLDSLKKRTGVDWERIVRHDAIPADITLPGGSWPSWFVWFINPYYWPVIRIRTSMTLPSGGRGLIIADSNLTIVGDQFDGIILVGGKLTVSGSGNVSGGVVSGLNLSLPGATSPAPGTSSDNDITRDSRRFDYNSCYVANASAKLRRYFVWPNTWLDNVSVW